MKCSLCGKPVEDGAAFCPFCGMRLGQEATGAQAGANVPPEAPAPEQQPAAAPGAGTAEGPVPGMGAAPTPGMPPYSGQAPYGQPYYTQPQQGMPYGGANGPVAGVNPYYAREFELIANGGKPHFNFAALFLGFWHTLYRGCIKRFLALYALPWLLTMVLVGVEMSIMVDSMYMAAMGVVPTGLLVVFLLSAVLSLVSLGLSIYNGATFNRYYYNLCKGDARVPKKTGLLVGAIALNVVLSIIGTSLSAVGIAGAAMHSGYPSVDDPGDVLISQSGPSAGVPDGELEEHAGTVMYTALTDATVPAEYSQILTESHIFAEDVPADILEAGALEQAGRAAYLFYSDAYTLGDMLDAVADDVRWSDAEPDEEDMNLYNGSLRCLVDDTVIELALSAFPLGDGDTCLSVMGGIVYKNGDMDADSYHICTPQQVNSFMKWLCVQAGAETPVSVARLAMGTWASADGQTLEVTEFSLNGAEMYLNNVAVSHEGALAVEYMTPDGYGYFEPSADGAAMTVYSYLDGSSEETVTQYTRVA